VQLPKWTRLEVDLNFVLSERKLSVPGLHDDTRSQWKRHGVRGIHFGRIQDAAVRYFQPDMVEFQQLPVDSDLVNTDDLGVAEPVLKPKLGAMTGVSQTAMRV
jgi:hypothetical protein